MIEQDPTGLSACELSQLGAAMVAQEAVLPNSTCHFEGCSASATVVCHGCCPQGTFLCEQHDAQLHQWAHTHRRHGLLNGFKQPLRPTQLQSAHVEGEESYEWADVGLVFDQPPCQPCERGHCSWQLDGSSSVTKDLNIITSHGK
jgi:hypothetical protein